MVDWLLDKTSKVNSQCIEHFYAQSKNSSRAACIFPNPTEAIRRKETEVSDWSNYEFDEPPLFSDIVDVNFNGAYF